MKLLYFSLLFALLGFAPVAQAQSLEEQYEAMIALKDLHVRTGAFYNFAKQASDEQLADMVRYINQLPLAETLTINGSYPVLSSDLTSQRRNGQTEILLVELVQRSPEKALAVAQEITVKNKGSGSIRQVYTHWAFTDLPAALQSVDNTMADDPETRRKFRLSMAYAIVTDEPVASWEIVKADGIEYLNQDSLRTLLSNVALADSDLAIAEAKLIEDPQFQSDLLKRIHRIKLMAGEVAPAEALKKWTATADSTSEMYRDVDHCIRQNPTATIEYLDGLDNSVNWKWDVLSYAFSQWSRTDPVAAFAWIEAHGKDERYQSIIYQNLPSLIRKDYAQSKAILDQQPIPQNYEYGIYEALLERQQANSFQERGEQIKAMAPERVWESLMLPDLQKWIASDLDATADYALNLKNEELQNQIFLRILNAYADKNPERGMEIWLSLKSPRKPSAQKLVGAYATLHPVETAAFVASLPSGQQHTYIEVVTTAYLAHNPEAALDWAITLESGYAKSQAIKIIMQESAKTDPILTTQLLDRLAAAGMDQEPHWDKLLQKWNDKTRAFFL